MNEQAIKQLCNLCAGMGVSEEVVAALIRQAGFIATWKSQIRPTDLTPTQRAKALRRLETLAQEMQLEVEGLPFMDRWAIDDALSEHDFGSLVLPSIRHALGEVRARIEKEASVGAPKLTERQADFIRCIAQALKTTDIPPANSGRFADICEAVFLAGGLTFPTRALRHFMKQTRPKLKADGLCK